MSSINWLHLIGWRLPRLHRLDHCYFHCRRGSSFNKLGDYNPVALRISKLVQLVAEADVVLWLVRVVLAWEPILCLQRFHLCLIRQILMNMRTHCSSESHVGLWSQPLQQTWLMFPWLSFCKVILVSLLKQSHLLTYYRYIIYLFAKWVKRIVHETISLTDFWCLRALMVWNNHFYSLRRILIKCGVHHVIWILVKWCLDWFNIFLLINTDFGSYLHLLQFHDFMFWQLGALVMPWLM